MQNLDIREFCWLVHYLPAESASKGAWSATDENVATMADLLIDGAIGSWQKNTFDPERWPAHKKQAEQAKRSMKPPSALPHVAAVAMRPHDVEPLTGIFQIEPTEQSGSAFEQLDSLIASL